MVDHNYNYNYIYIFIISKYFHTVQNLPTKSILGHAPFLFISGQTQPKPLAKSSQRFFEALRPSGHKHHGTSASRSIPLLQLD
jgi:hypothetical protein